MTPASNTSTSLAALASALRAGEWVDLTPTIENGMPELVMSFSWAIFARK